MKRSVAASAAILVSLAFAACSDSTSPPPETPFIEGTPDDAQIGLVVNSTSNALRLFQLSDPAEIREIALGASSAVTPTGISVGGGWIAVPLGNAASVALIEAATQRIERFFLFPSGNTTGSVFTNDGALLVANLVADEVGRVTLDQAGNAIENRISVAPSPTDIEIAGEHALVLSGNLDDAFAPLGEGIVTAVDPVTLTVLDTVSTGGENPNASAVGPDGLLYVVNTGNYVDPGTMAIIDPATMELVDLVTDLGPGPGAISIDAEGLAYISGFSFGTLVFDTDSRTFLRGLDNPLCAPLPGGNCRGAFSAEAASDGSVYQVFFGSTSEGLAPWIFVYSPDTYALSDSIAPGLGPTALTIRTFEY